MASRGEALAGNQPFLLAPAGTWWVVTEGSLALFAVTLENREPTGPRHPLGTVEAGEAALGIGAAEDPRGVLAVPLGASRVVEASVAGFQRLMESEPERTAGLLVNWAKRWEALGVEVPVPDEDMTPAAAGEWLDGLHGNVRAHLAERAREAKRTERQRIQDDAHSALESGKLARRKLRAVLQEDDAPPPLGDPLLQALSAVGDAAGIAFRPLTGAQRDEKDPAEAFARAAKVRARRVNLAGAWWRCDNGPLLAYEREGHHPVALLPVGDGDGYVLVDPARERRVRVGQKIAATLEPRARTFYRPLPDGPLTAVGLLRFSLRGRAKDVTRALAAGLVATFLGMILPVATGLVVDEVIPDADRPLLWQLCAILLAAACGAGLYRVASGVFLLRLETHADALAQAGIWDRLLRLPARFFRQFTAGDLHTRVSAVRQIRQILSGTTLRTLFAAVLSLANFALLVYYSPLLSLVPLATAVISLSLMAGAALLLWPVERGLHDARGELMGAMVQLVQGVPKLRAAAAEERAYLYWAERYSAEQALTLRAQAIRDHLGVAHVWLGGLAAVVLFALAVGPVSAETNAMSIGEFLAFYTAFGLFIGGVLSLGKTAPELLRVAVLERRAQPILDAEPETDARSADPGRLDGRVRLERIVFRYQEDGPLVLRDVSLHAEPGEMIAIVGQSGCGKSTILRLLLGFEAPESGAVLLDGQDVRGLDMDAARRQMGVVLENGRISAGTIFSNVAGGTGADREEVIEALRSVGLEDEVSALPLGLDTVISEGGSNISTGQRQRLLIARALLHEPRVLLLDEATSALDRRVQSVVQHTLERARGTRVVVAHRLDTVRAADRIYVIEDGRVAEEGTYAELSRRDGPFKRLMAHQLR